MFEKLLELLSHFWAALMPFEVVDAYEAGVVLRFGVYARTVGPGLSWKWPVVERVVTARTCLTTIRLASQTLTTKDQMQVVVSAIVKYSIKDVKPYLLEVWDQQDVLGDVTAGAVRRAVEARHFVELVDEKWEQAVLEKVRREVARYGFHVERITYADLGRIRSMRLLLPSFNLAQQPTEQGQA